MIFLLDTHILLWWFFDSPKLSKTLRGIISEPSNTILVSAASAWEIGTKFRIGKLPEAQALISDYAMWIDKAGFSELPMTAAHALRAGTFVNDHKDPFDRMLAAQSSMENIPLCTSDESLESFGLRIIR
jgi:PIN domain nuclease of toxin-antitoxin system